MAITYSLTALLSPAPQVPAELGIPGTDPADKASLLVAGSSGSGSLTTPFNTNARHLDNVGIAGGCWAYAIITGLALSAGSGLTLNISAGAAGVGAVPTVTDVQTKALTDNSNNHVWLLRDGSISLRQNVLTPPATPAVYLGRVVTSGGVQGDPDYSGRVENRGGTLYRKTADVGTPADSPPAGIQLITETSDGLYLWTGSNYQQLATAGSAGFAVERVTATQNLLVPLYHQMLVFDGSLQIDGTLTISGKVRIQA